MHLEPGQFVKLSVIPKRPGTKGVVGVILDFIHPEPNVWVLSFYAVSLDHRNPTDNFFLLNVNRDRDNSSNDWQVEFHDGTKETCRVMTDAVARGQKFPNPWGRDNWDRNQLGW